MSEPFRGGDTLMMYSYMFPATLPGRAARPLFGSYGERAARRRSVPVLHRAHRHVGRHDAALRGFGRQSCRRGPSAHRTCCRLRARQGLEAYAVSLGGKQHVPPRLRRRRSRRRAGADHDRVQTLARWRRQAALGQRIVSRAARSRSGSAPPRDRRTTLDPVRPHACRTPGARRADRVPLLSRIGVSNSRTPFSVLPLGWTHVRRRPVGSIRRHRQGIPEQRDRLRQPMPADRCPWVIRGEAC